MSETKSSGGSFGLAFILTIIFVVLKLTHLIHWSWVWVLSPLWISVGLCLAIVIIIAIVLGTIAVIASKKGNKRAA